MHVGDRMCVQLHFLRNVHVDVLVGGGLIHVTETQQLQPKIGAFSLKCASIDMCMCVPHLSSLLH